MQTAYQSCATLTFVIWHCAEQRQWDGSAERFTSLTAHPRALISDSLMLSGSQTVQSGVQRKETSQIGTNTQRPS